jgi:dTMP kinase
MGPIEAGSGALFITLEGIEGSGKTSQMGFVADFLQARGLACTVTREPGGTPLGARIRALLLDPANQHMAPTTELLLYFADRAQHLHQVVRPALESGRAVVCDRYVDATLAYQGAARGLGPERLRRLHDLLLDGLMPDLTLLFDLDPAAGLSRARRDLERGGRPAGEARFENEHLEFHRRVREGYLELARREPGRFRRLDAARPPEAVQAQIARVLTEFLDRRPGPAPVRDPHSPQPC